MGQARINRSNKPKPEANRSAKDVTESHERPRRFAWNPFSGKLKPSWFSPVWRKWRKSEKRSSSWPELPPEIIREILIRLPIKSIGRSRCVSKLFRSLSSDPGFAKSQLDLMTAHRKLIVSSHNDVVLLYNPTTRESKLLPAESTETVKRYREKFISYGFRFDHLTNDYKVVKLVADSNNLLYACVYSLKSDSWRWIRDLSYQHIDRFCFNCFPPGLNLNGVIHWVFTLQQGSRKRKVILAFDIITEEFGEMPYPTEARSCPYRFMVGSVFVCSLVATSYMMIFG
ncbi:unnamed protein product [Brassica oleracea]